MRRINIKKILADPDQRRELLVRSVIAIHAREGIVTTIEQAEQAAKIAQKERVTWR